MTLDIKSVVEESPERIQDMRQVRSSHPEEYWREKLDIFLSERAAAEGRVKTARQQIKFAQSDEAAALDEVNACQRNVEDCFKELQRYELARLQPEV